MTTVLPPTPYAGHQARSARATVMFVDVIGFTGLAEQLGPEVAYFAVTGAMRILDGIARKYGGSVDKYLGDCLMAVFGHPVPVAAPARAAASAGPHPKPRIGRGARPPA